jgi:hypothetical protein
MHHVIHNICVYLVTVPLHPLQHTITTNTNHRRGTRTCVLRRDTHGPVSIRWNILHCVSLAVSTLAIAFVTAQAKSTHSDRERTVNWPWSDSELTVIGPWADSELTVIGPWADSELTVIGPWWYPQCGPGVSDACRDLMYITWGLLSRLQIVATLFYFSADDDEISHIETTGSCSKETYCFGF